MTKRHVQVEVNARLAAARHPEKGHRRPRPFRIATAVTMPRAAGDLVRSVCPFSGNCSPTAPISGPVDHRALAGILPDLGDRDRQAPSDRVKGFVVQPRRWATWSNAPRLESNRCRRLAKGWENLNRIGQRRSDNLHQRGLASIRLMLRKQLYSSRHKVSGRTLSVLASLEFHGSHPGWHLHASCGDAEEVPKGVMRGPWQNRYPRARRFHRQMDFDISGDGKALHRASAFFGLHESEGTLL